MYNLTKSKWLQYWPIGQLANWQFFLCPNKLHRRLWNSISKFLMTTIPTKENKYVMLLCQRIRASCLLLRVSVTKWQSIRVYLSFRTLALEPYFSPFNLLFRNPIQLNLSFELGLQKMFMLFERSILEILKRRSNVFASKFLTANIFESGPMPTPWKSLDRTPLLPSCKLGQN